MESSHSNYPWCVVCATYHEPPVAIAVNDRCAMLNWRDRYVTAVGDGMGVVALNAPLPPRER